MTNSVEFLRRVQIDQIKRGKPQAVVCMRLQPDIGGLDLVSGAKDADGDAIELCSRRQFVSVGQLPPVSIVIPLGSDPAVLARVLRKCATMLDGVHGQDITRLGNSKTAPTEGVRMANGDAYLYRPVDEVAKLLVQRGADGDAKGATGSDQVQLTPRMRMLLSMGAQAKRGQRQRRARQIVIAKRRPSN